MVGSPRAPTARADVTARAGWPRCARRPRPRRLSAERRHHIAAFAISLITAVWVPATLSTSRDLPIFVEDAAEPVVSFDLVDLGWCAVEERS